MTDGDLPEVPRSDRTATRTATGAAVRPPAHRWPFLVVLVALVAAATALASRPTDSEAPAPEGPDPRSLMPVANAPDAPASTWFCAGGSGRGTAVAPDPKIPDTAKILVAEHSVVIANASARDQRALVTAVPSEGEQVSRTVTLPARSRVQVDLPELARAPAVSGLVETDGGDVAVEHAITGPTGRSVAPCASTTSRSWYFPAGTTRLGTRQYFSIFNPFPDQAVVDFAFQTDEGFRETDKLRGLVIPASRTVLVDITDAITVRSQIATTASVRTGRAVIDQVVVTDGTNGQPASLALVPGAPAVATTSVFADGPALGPGVTQEIFIFNPSSEDTTATVQVRPDGAGPETVPAPERVPVRARQYAQVTLTADRLPAGVGNWVAVASDGAGLVVERVVRAVSPARPVAGVYTLGSPLVAPRWFVADLLAGDKAGQVAIVNPSVADPVTLTIRVVRAGTDDPLARFDSVSLPAGGRTTLDLTSISRPEETSLVVEASGAVVVERRIEGEGGGAATIEIPSVVGAGPLSADVFAGNESTTPAPDLETLGSVPGTLPPREPPPGSAPPGTADGATTEGVGTGSTVAPGSVPPG